jgi:hypothetical protein
VERNPAFIHQFKFDRKELEYFKKSDWSVFQKICEAQSRRPLKINSTLTRLQAITPALHHYIWTPLESQTIGLGHPRDKRISLLSLIHGCVHSIFWRQFGIGFKGFPKSVLLVEAIASSMDTYFFLALLAQGHLKPQFFMGNFYRNSLNIKGKKFDFEAFILKKAKQPYRGFLGSVDQIYSLTDFLIQNQKDLQSYEPKSLARLEKMVTSSNAIFTAGFDVGIFSYYIKSECGRKSSKNDQMIYSRILKILRESKTMSELMARVLAV